MKTNCPSPLYQHQPTRITSCCFYTFHTSWRDFVQFQRERLSKTCQGSNPAHREMLSDLYTLYSLLCVLYSVSRCFLQEFTQSCLRHEAKLRPTAHDLLFHRVLFEVHSLKLIAAHCLINNQCEFLTSTRRAHSTRISSFNTNADIYLFLCASNQHSSVQMLAKQV